MTTQHSTPHLPVCASLPGRSNPYHLRSNVALLPTSKLYHLVATLWERSAGQFYKNVRWQQMGASTNERARTRCVEAGMEMQAIIYQRQTEDVAERQDLKRLDDLAGRLKEITNRRIERDEEENRDHELLAQIAREFTALADQLQLRETTRTTAA